VLKAGFRKCHIRPQHRLPLGCELHALPTHPTTPHSSQSVESMTPPAVQTRFTRGRVWELKNGHNSVTVQNRTHVYINFFHHKGLGNHLLQLCPKVVKHSVYNPVHKGNWPHSFTSGYLPVMLQRLHSSRWYGFDVEKLPRCFWRSSVFNLYKVSRADRIQNYTFLKPPHPLPRRFEHFWLNLLVI